MKCKLEYLPYFYWLETTDLRLLLHSKILKTNPNAQLQHWLVTTTFSLQPWLLTHKIQDKPDDGECNKETHTEWTNLFMSPSNSITNIAFVCHIILKPCGYTAYMITVESSACIILTTFIKPCEYNAAISKDTV